MNDTYTLGRQSRTTRCCLSIWRPPSRTPIRSGRATQWDSSAMLTAMSTMATTR